MQALTGQDQVWYSKKGSKFHVCKQAALVTGRIQPQNLTSGTVAQAHADGVDELTKLWPTEARKHLRCSRGSDPRPCSRAQRV